MIVTETQAKIDGDVDHFVKVGGTLRLSCRVYLGHQGPDDVYAKTAVIHWFHDQRLLDLLSGRGLILTGVTDMGCGAG